MKKKDIYYPRNRSVEVEGILHGVFLQLIMFREKLKKNNNTHNLPTYLPTYLPLNFINISTFQCDSSVVVLIVLCLGVEFLCVLNFCAFSYF